MSVCSVTLAFFKACHGCQYWDYQTATHFTDILVEFRLRLATELRIGVITENDVVYQVVYSENTQYS